jgi:hypothetical protein
MKGSSWIVFYASFFGQVSVIVTMVGAGRQNTRQVALVCATFQSSLAMHRHAADGRQKGCCSIRW